MQTTADPDPASPPQIRSAASAPRRTERVWDAARPVLGFLFAWAFLDAVLNVRYPASEPKFWWLIPSVDVLGLFALFAVLGWRGVRVPRWGHAVLAASFVAVRLLRFGDGIKYRYFNRPFNLYLDVPLVPELARLMNDTVTPLGLALALAGLILGLALVALGVGVALRVAERSLARPWAVATTLGVTALFLAYSPFYRPPVKHEHRFAGAFAASGVARWVEELAFLLEVSGYRSAKVAEIQRVQEELARMPADLSRLGRADVLLFLVESYGETVLEREDFSRRMADVFAGYERDLGAKGYAFASSVLDSTTYGGSSWLAHATLATGVRVENQMHYALIETSRPLTFAELFRRAGYRTVRVEPGTTRESAHGAFQGFVERYGAARFDYRGPRFGWAPMPDQYVLDFVHRREVAAPRDRPLFVEYVLVSSHAPWSEQPALAPSFGEIGDGAIYARLAPVRFPVTWPDLAIASAAYLRSVCYDFEVLKRYLTELVEDGTLVLIVGDHQPAVEVARDRDAYGVPVHVMSTNAEFVARFRELGYGPGMRPRAGRRADREGLESLLRGVVSEFSSGGARAHR